MDYITKDEKAFDKLLPALKEIEEAMRKKSADKPVKRILPRIKKFLTDSD
jgi:hypothetical protein